MGRANVGEVLLRVADQLCADFGHPEEEQDFAAGSRLEVAGFEGILCVEDEELVTTMRLSLARVAAAAVSTARKRVHLEAVSVALDSAELVTRGELVRGNADRIPLLLPGFVFLVTVGVTGQERALELSSRTTEVIEARG